MLYALRIVGRSGFQKRNGYWRIGKFIRWTIYDSDTGKFGSYEPVSVVFADVGSKSMARSLRAKFKTAFPDIETKIIRFVEG